MIKNDFSDIYSLVACLFHDTLVNILVLLRFATWIYPTYVLSCGLQC